MKRLLHLMEYAASSLWRRKLKNISLVAIYTFFVTLIASVLFLSDSLKEEMHTLLSHSPELIVQYTSVGRHSPISESLVDSIKEIAGVKNAYSRIWGYYYDPITSANYTIMGIENNEEKVDLLSGRLPRNAGECAIGFGVASLRKVSLSEDLVLLNSQNTGTLFEIVGVFRSSSQIMTNDLVLISSADARDFFAISKGEAIDIVVSIANSNEVETIARKIKHHYPRTRPISRSEIIRTYDAVFNWRSGFMFVLFISALIAFMIMSWQNAAGISAEEKSEVAILKAIGWDTGDILLFKFWEGFIISATSFLSGIIVSFIHVFYANAFILLPLLSGWSVLFPPLRPHPNIQLYQLVTLGFLTVLPYMVSILIPAWRTAIMDPDEIMKG